MAKERSIGAIALDLALNSSAFEKGLQTVVSKASNAMKSAFDTSPDVAKKMQSAFDGGVKGLEKMSKSSDKTTAELGGKLLPMAQKLAPTFTKVAGAVGGIVSGVGTAIGVVTALVGAVKKFDEMSDKALARVKQGFNEIVGGIRQTIDFVKKLTGKSDKFENEWSTSLRNIGYLVVSVFGIRQLYEFSKASVNAASQTQAAWVGLNSIVKGQGKSFKDAEKFINDYIADGLVPLNNAVTAYKNLIAAGYEEKQAQDMMERLKDAAAFGRQSHLTLGDAVTTATEGIKNQNSTLTDNAGVTKNLSVMYAEYAATIGKGAGSLTEAEKRTATYNGIMKETRFQVGDAAKITETFNGKVVRLSSTLTNLKTAFGNVVIPIIEIFIPTLQKAMEVTTQFFNTVAGIMAQFGLKMKTAEELSSGAISNIGSSAVDTASDITSTGDAAKEAAKKINTAFNSVDEINVLDTSSNATGSDSSSGDGSGSSTGEELKDLQVEVEQTETLLDKLKKTAFEYGEMFAEKINGALEKINWSKIQKTTKTIATNIANFLNGAVAELDWNLVGSTIGNGINTALIFVNTFLKTFDWTEWGKSLANGLNGIILKVDWRLLGQTIANYFNMSIDTFASFVKNFKWNDIGLFLGTGLNSLVKNIHWDNIAQGLIDGINGAMKALGNFIKVTDWKAIGTNIKDTLTKIIEGVDWKNAGKTITKLADNVLTLISDVLKEVDFDKAIREFFKGFDLSKLINKYLDIKYEMKKLKWQVAWEVMMEEFEAGIQWVIGKLPEFLFGGIAVILKGLWDVGVAIIEGILKGCLDMLVNIGKWIVDNIFKPIWNGLLSAFGIHSPSKETAKVGVFIIEGLLKGIKDKIAGVSNWIKENVFTPFMNAFKKLFGIKSPSTEMAKQGDFIVQGLYKGINDKKTWFTNKWKEVKGWFTNITATASVKIGTKWSDLKSKWNSLMSNFKDKTITVKTKIGEVIGNLKSTINNNVIKKINSKLPSIFPKIPLLAQGGWFAANNPQLAIVGDNKREAEIVAPESKIEDAVMRGLLRSGNNATNNKLELEILVKYEDGRKIIKKINDYQIQQGKVLLMT